MDPCFDQRMLINRRQFFDHSCRGVCGAVGLAALGDLLQGNLAMAGEVGAPGVPLSPHAAPNPWPVSPTLAAVEPETSSKAPFPLLR